MEYTVSQTHDLLRLPKVGEAFRLKGNNKVHIRIEDDRGACSFNFDPDAVEGAIIFSVDLLTGRLSNFDASQKFVVVVGANGEKVKFEDAPR